MKKSTIAIVSFLVALAIVGGYFFPTIKGSFGATSATGTTNNVTSWSSITFLPLTASTTSLLNTGASDRAILGSYTMCTSATTVRSYGAGAGLANFTVQAATTSADGSTKGLEGNVNYIVNESVATSTGTGYTASTTEGVIYGISRIWPVNTYLTFITNATTTASCSFGVEWLPL